MSVVYRLVLYCPTSKKSQVGWLRYRHFQVAAVVVRFEATPYLRIQQTLSDLGSPTAMNTTLTPGKLLNADLKELDDFYGGRCALTNEVDPQFCHILPFAVGPEVTHVVSTVRAPFLPLLRD